jgi:NitT/TauT family transport system substrate-binding protein
MVLPEFCACDNNSRYIRLFIWGYINTDLVKKRVLMGGNLNIRVGHLKIIDHLILGYSVFRLGSNGDPLHHSTLENIPMNSWEQICDGLRKGDIHGAFITAPLAMDLFAAGLDISMLMFVHRSGSLMVRNRQARIKSLVDLQEKTILIPSVLSVQHLLLHKLLTAAGFSLNSCSPAATGDITTEAVTAFLMPQMLENDQDLDIAAYMAPEPYGSQAIARGFADRFCTSDSLWKDHPCCIFVIRNDLESSQGKAIEELVRHFFQSAAALNTQLLKTQIDEQTLNFAQDFLGQEQGIVKQALLNSGISFTPSKLCPDKDTLDIIQTYMTDTMGVMPQTIDLDAFLKFSHATKAISEMKL